MDSKQKIGTRPIFLTIKVLLFGLLVSYCDAVGKRWQEGEHVSYIPPSAFSNERPKYRPQDCINIMCGYPNTASRIAGGRTTSFDDFPWMAGLYSEEENKTYCGASLIGRQTLLTAAHCFSYDRKYKVALADGKLHEIETIKIHPRYNDITNDNDIAILQLTEVIQIMNKTSTVHPICLPYHETNFDKATAVVSGWGQISYEGPLSKILRQASVPIMSASRCRANSDYAPNRITDNMICAGYSNGGIDSCQGDSGGPLQVRNARGAMELIGIVSYGKRCAEPRLPGVYTKVQNYLEWISDEMGTDCIGVDDPYYFASFY